MLCSTSVLTGQSEYSEIVDVNLGYAGIFSPIDKGFTEDGVLAQATDNASGWLIQSLDFELISNVRQHGDVRNFLDNSL